jgi:CRISPR/Cas system-associated exonuclease Cas4 (RecB family)
MTLPSPIAQPLRALSPSSYEVLRTCPLRLAFGQASSGHGPRTDALLIGEACHEVLESLVADGLVSSGRWSEELHGRFESAVAARFSDHGASPPGASLARARLRKAGTRIERLLAEAPADADVITEAKLQAANGRLAGRIDLIVRSAQLHLLVDYKTGAVTDVDGHPTDRLRRQLMLYACLEAEEHGWPHRAQLMPLGRQAIEIAIEPAKCQALLAEGLEALDRWQGWVGEAPPPQPSPEACGHCRYAPRCPAMWEAWSDGWTETFRAVSGRLSASSSTPLGGITISLQAERGSTLGEVTVRNIDGRQHPCLVDAEPGDEIFIVGLREDAAEGVCTLAPWARSHREPQLRQLAA